MIADYVVAGVSALAVSAGIVAYLARRAPDGIQDADGFHAGGETLDLAPFELDAPGTVQDPFPTAKDIKQMKAARDLALLTRSEKLVLMEMDEEIGWSAGVLSGRTGMNQSSVSRARLRLSDLGLARLAQLFDECSGLAAGRGYLLTPAGVAARAQLYAEGFGLDTAAA